MRVLPIPGGPERKDRTDLACPGPVAWSVAGHPCQWFSGVQMLMWITRTSAASVVDKTPVLNGVQSSMYVMRGFDSESAMGVRRLCAALARLLLVI